VHARTTGGDPPFTFHWSDGTTGQADTLDPGDYWLTVTDAFGCHDSIDFGSPPPPD